MSVSDVGQAVRGGVFLESVVEHGDGHSLHAEMGLVWQQVEAVANPLETGGLTVVVPCLRVWRRHHGRHHSILRYHLLLAVARNF